MRSTTYSRSRYRQNSTSISRLPKLSNFQCSSPRIAGCTRTSIRPCSAKIVTAVSAGFVVEPSCVRCRRMRTKLSQSNRPKSDPNSDRKWLAGRDRTGHVMTAVGLSRMCRSWKRNSQRPVESLLVTSHFSASSCNREQFVRKRPRNHKRRRRVACVLTTAHVTPSFRV